MLSVLVCHSYFLHLDQKQLQRGKPYPALATLQVAAMLRKTGRRVALFRRDDRRRAWRSTNARSRACSRKSCCFTRIRSIS